MPHTPHHNAIGLHDIPGMTKPSGIHRFQLLGRAQKLAVLALLVLLLGAVLVFVLRFMHDSALAENSKDHSKIYVNYVTPSMDGAQGVLKLPGNLQGFAETQVFARSSGYVVRWNKDMGDRVNKGDVLAELDTPEIAQQLNEAKASRQQVESTLALARSSFERWKTLRAQDAVSQQEFDERRAALAQSEATKASSDATVKRLTQVLSYNRIVAPFAGIVTKRNIDVGNLVDVGNGGAPKQLFAIAQLDPLRVYISIPQNYAPQVKVGSEAKITLVEIPGKVFMGKVVRTAGAIDATTRTMQVEINLPNADGKLLPGAYAEVELKTAQTATPKITIPNNALLFRPEGTMVAVVQADGKVHLQKVSLGRDLGTQIELTDGVAPQDHVVINPPDSLYDGAPVVATVLAPPKSKGTPAPAAGSGATPAPNKASAPRAMRRTSLRMA